ncbi:uncharacterized protein LOC122666165 isoform X2 [Telopea speciosissima]|uniref:uncharacterized protein LOC122666165 isoform X2 n=1 Tax=Telopea speciosissima TaxID=54955 RepID=UPI001CC762AA|nr:uncharacterized protein LOC122666165 isoform X2 [Telopea speciosissima]
MGKRRFKQVSTSDEEDEEEVPGPSSRRPSSSSSQSENHKKKKVKLEEEESESSENEDEAVVEDAKPIGEVIKTTGKGRGRRTHHNAFEYDGNRFELDIAQTSDGSVMVTGQWFYRPEEAEKKGGGSWETHDTRELFYSFHHDEVPAESVMHKCVVHFVPLQKQLPQRSQNPGFIVQKVYDTVERKLWKLTDKDYEDKKQHEIDLLVQKTRERLGELPDIEPEDPPVEQEETLKNKRYLRRKNISPLDVSREDDATRPDLKAETPGSGSNDASEFYSILANFKALTGDSYRDKCLGRLLQAIQYACISKDYVQADDKDKVGSACIDGAASGNNGCQESMKGDEAIHWPDAAVAAVTSLERVSHETLAFDFTKYNQKMRQLVFNLKSNAMLARRLVKRELEPSRILNMSPNELKDALTEEETPKEEPEESERMQMTDARCKRCMEKKVGLTDIIRGARGDRYQLQCIACGNTWFAFRDEVSTLTIEAASVVGNVGTAPWATAKFEDVEKKLVTPRESEKPDSDIFKKITAPYIPVLQTQKSFGKAKTEDPLPTSNNAV